MNSKYEHFLDDTSLLTTPMPPSKTSTSTKENNSFLKNQGNLDPCNSVFLPSENVAYANEASHMAVGGTTKILNFDSSESLDSSVFSEAKAQNSSLGIMNLSNLTGLSEFEFLKPSEPPPKASKENAKRSSNMQKRPKKKENAENSSKQFTSSKHRSKKETKSANEGKKFDFLNFEDLVGLGKEVQPEDNQIFDPNRLSFCEKLKSLYGDESAAVMEILTSDSAETDKNKNANVEKNCQAETRHVGDLNKSTFPSEISTVASACTSSAKQLPAKPSFETPQKRNIFQAFDMELNDTLNRLLERAKENLNEKTPTPSTTNFPFANFSSFQVDDVNSDSLYLNTPSSGPQCSTKKSNDSEVEFRKDQISARSSSLNFPKDSIDGHSVEQNSNLLSRKNEPPEILSESYSKPHITKENFCDYENMHHDTALAFQANLFEQADMSEFFPDEQHCRQLGLSGEAFLSPSAAIACLDDDEKEFEKAHMLEIDINDPRMSQFSSWSVLNQPLEGNRPSWWSDANNSKSFMQLSVGQIIAARTEDMGTLCGDNERERPFFGMKIVTPPRGTQETSTSVSQLNESNDLQKDLPGSVLGNSTPQCDQASLFANSGVNSVLGFSAISQIISDMSVDDASKIAATLYAKVSHKGSRNPNKMIQSNFCQGIPNRNNIFEYVQDALTLPSGYSTESTITENRPIKELVINSEIGNSFVTTKGDRIREYCTDQETNAEKYKKLLSGAANEENAFLKPRHVKRQIIPDQLQRKALPRSKSLESVADVTDTNLIVVSTPAGPANFGRIGKELNFMSTTTDSEPTDSESGSSTKTVSEITKPPACVSCQQSQHAQLLPGRADSACSHNSLPISCTNLGSGIHVPGACISKCNAVQDFRTLPVVNCIPPTVVGGPLVNQGFQHKCTNEYMNFGRSLNLAATYPVNSLFCSSIPSCSFPVGLSNTAVAVCIEGPKEFLYPFTCVGDNQKTSLWLRNPTNMNLYYHLSIGSAKFNGDPIPSDSIGLTIPEVITAAGGSNINVQLAYCPKFEGEIQVDLQVRASVAAAEDLFYQTVGLPLIMKVVLPAERARVCLSSCGQINDLKLLNVLEEATVTGYVTMTNFGKASVPVRLHISEDANEQHSFTFNIQEREIFSRCSDVLEWRFLSPKIMLCRLVGNTDESKEKKLNIPVLFCAGKSHHQKVVKVHATLTAELDSNVTSDLLALFRLSAELGSAQLSLLPPAKGPLLLKTQENSSVNRNLTLINKGNIAVTVDLRVHCDSDFFTVVPSTVQMHPQKDVRIVLHFNPLAPAIYIGTLRATVRQNCSIFNLAEVVGDAGSSVESQTMRSRPDAFQIPQASRASFRPTVFLESNKKFLAWGGVDINQNNVKEICIRNPLSSEKMNAKAYIRDCHQPFQLIIDGSDPNVSTLDIVLQPKMQKQIKVAFCPLEVGPYSARLLFKPQEVNGDQAVFSIPLSGYCGTSNVKITSILEKEGSEYNLRLTTSVEADFTYGNITFSNTGCRAAFIKAFALKGSHSDFYGRETRITVEPSKFILLEQESKTVLVSYHNDSLEDSFNRSQKSALLLFYFGDEVMRQRMRLCTACDVPVTGNHQFNRIDFDVPFAGEESVPFDKAYASSPRDLPLFFNTLRKIAVNLTLSLENTSLFSRQSFASLTMLQDSIRSTASSPFVPARYVIGNSPPVKDSSTKLFHASKLNSHEPVRKPIDFTKWSVNGGGIQHATISSVSSEGPLTNISASAKFSERVTGDNTLCDTVNNVITENASVFAECEPVNGVCNDEKESIFSIEPAFLTLDTDNRDGRFVIINNSTHDIRFKLSWAVNIICVSPVQGTVHPRGQMGIRVKVVPHYDRKATENDGFIKVHCSGEEKYIPVKIVKNTNKSKLLNKSRRKSLNSEASLSSSNLDTSKNFVAPDPFLGLDIPKVIELKDTVVGQQSEASLHVKAGNEALKWSIRNPIYSEMNDGSLCLAHDITALPSSGLLKKGESITVKIQFLPSHEEIFAQTWELCLENLGGFQKLFKINVQGRSFLDMDSTASRLTNFSGLSSGSLSSTTKSRKRSSVSAKPFTAVPEVVEFPDTQIGQRVVLRISMKNSSASDCKVTVVKPSSPFAVKRDSVILKSRRFVNLPVTFNPTSASFYESSLVLRDDSGYCAKIILKGSGVL